MSTPPALALLGVSRCYGTTQALRATTLQLQPGRIHALVGENGAGKSTATKLLAGLEQPDAGTVLIDGAAVNLRSRAAGIRHGVGLVPQRLSLNPEMNLVENLLLTQPSQLTHRRRAIDLLERAAADAGLDLDLTAAVRMLGLAERQHGELAIALAQGARSLLLDEPTSALGPHESDALFEHLRHLARSGVTVLLVTHRLAEVRSIADEVTVLSRGEVALSAAVADVTDDDLVGAMLGDLQPFPASRRNPSGALVLQVTDVTARGPGAVDLHQVSLSVRSGEVLGVLGVAGNGQNVLAEVAAGLRPAVTGTVTVGGVEITGRPDRALSAGVSHVPQDRGAFLLPAAPITSSAVLRRLREARFTRWGGLRHRVIRAFAADLAERSDVRPRDVRVMGGALSGGNQQKLLVGRELEGRTSVAVLHGPTQGLDLHAAAVVHARIRDTAGAGAAVLLVSADLDEVRALADRVVVISRGRIVDELRVDEFDLHRVGRSMAGLPPAAPTAPSAPSPPAAAAPVTR